MNKKLMAVAVAGALAAPGMALAQSSTVQIGGGITTLAYKHDPNNPSAGQSSDILESSEPELYIRGEEKLGGGLSVWFQCASSLDGITGGSDGAQGLCARNSAIGFKGSFGNVFQGNWDQPQKLVYNHARGWWSGTNSLAGGGARLLFNGSASGAINATQSITPSPVIGGATGASTSMSSGANAFYRRQAQSWNYQSPSWSGFNVMASVSAANEQTGNPEASSLSQRMYGLAAQYQSGPLYLGVGYENHNDYNPANQTIGAAASAYSGGNDTNWTLVAGYKYAAFNVRGVYSKSEYDTNNVASLKAKGWGIYADWAIAGPHTVRLQYVTVDDTSGSSGVSVGGYKAPRASTCGVTSTVSCANNTGADVWGLAYSYAFSKRTEGSVVYSKMSNDSGASFSKGKTSATAGSDQTTYGVVLKHRF